MSFILDALKKAEAERQRQTGPTLLEVRVAPPRRRLPLWTLIIGALLGINIVLLMVFVLRRPAPNSAASPATASIAAPAPVVSAPSTPPPQVLAPLPVPATAAAPAAAPAPTPSLTDVAKRNGAGDAVPGNPADYEPALPASEAAPPRRTQDVPARREPPSMAEVGADLPELRLDLHVYATRAADRYALINMHRVREGDVLPEGPRVVAIDRDGVELSYRGTEFMLHPQ